MAFGSLCAGEDGKISGRRGLAGASLGAWKRGLLLQQIFGKGSGRMCHEMHSTELHETTGHLTVRSFESNRRARCGFFARDP